MVMFYTSLTYLLMVILQKLCMITALFLTMSKVQMFLTKLTLRFVLFGSLWQFLVPQSSNIQAT